MRRPAAVLLLVLGLILTMRGLGEAQDEPPPIGPFVVDVRASVPNFPRDPQLAAGRGLDAGELPGRALGVDVGIHVYLLTWKVVTVGIGGQLTLARSHFSPEPDSGLRAVTERVISIAPQLSLNFGSGDGWSYLSGGVGSTIWSLAPDGQPPGPADQERLQTLNYGGGARWFSNPHLAFTFDVRFHAVTVGTPYLGRPGSPRTTLLVMSAGVSLK